MPLRVAFDLDGTIADMEGALQREAEKLFGPNVQLRPAGSDHMEPPAHVEDVADDPTKVVSRTEKKVLSGRQLRQLWEHVAGIENFWMTLRETRSFERVTERGAGRQSQRDFRCPIWQRENDGNRDIGSVLNHDRCLCMSSARLTKASMKVVAMWSNTGPIRRSSTGPANA